jgi:hypothetical protein
MLTAAVLLIVLTLVLTVKGINILMHEGEK